MDSVMNFLADNYIWFFVASGVLLFALIGFIIDSKKKKKNEFKGESIEENKTEVPTEVVSEITSEQVNSLNNVETVSSIEPEPSINEAENTLEINDIPLSDNNNLIGSPVEFTNNEVEPLTEELNLEEKPELPIEELNLDDNKEL